VSIATRAVFTGALPDALQRSGVVQLTAAPDGGWTHMTEPHAIHHAGVTYFGFIDGDDGHVKVGAFDHATEVTTLTTLGTAPQVDNHDAPTVHVRDSDGRIMVWWSGHLGANLYQRISSNPLDISAFGGATDLDSQLGNARYTYPTAYQLDNGTLHLFYRDHPTGADYGRLMHSTSTNGGSTWAAGEVLVQQTGRDPYWFIGSNDSDRIDIAVSDGSPVVEVTTTVHHLYTDGTDWFGADGADLGSPPFTASALPEVYDGADGPAWPTSVLTTGPTFIYEVDVNDTHCRRAQWNGTAWDTTSVVDCGGPGHATLDPADPDTVYATVWVGPRAELLRYDIPTMTMTPVTDDSPFDTNASPVQIHRAPWDRRIIWLRGSINTYLDWNTGIWAAR